MEALQDAFDRADVGKSGRLDRDAVLRLLRNLQFRPSLRDHEVSVGRGPRFYPCVVAAGGGTEGGGLTTHRCVNR